MVNETKAKKSPKPRKKSEDLNPSAKVNFHLLNLRSSSHGRGNSGLKKRSCCTPTLSDGYEHSGTACWPPQSGFVEVNGNQIREK